MENYNDYIFEDGNFIGNFEEMYQKFDNPWSQQSSNYNQIKHTIIYNIIERYQPKKILEIGTGFGKLAHEIQRRNPQVDLLGIDISSTAIQKAQKSFPECKFKVGTLTDYKIYEEFKPDMIILSWLLWFILDDLDDFINYMKKEHPSTKILNCVTVYPKEQQKYGLDKFNTHQEIMDYFKANYLEWGNVVDNGTDHNCFFLANYLNKEQR